MSNPESGSTAAPVLGADRIASLDVLRGVAILGILVVNIYAFAMPYPAAYNNPYLMGGADALNMGVWFFTRIFVDQKFLTIFSMLFGAGIILMTSRAQPGATYGRVFYRRQFWLLLIGALHGYLIWRGDILFAYAMIGMLVYLFRNRTPRSLLISAFAFLLVAFLMSYGTGTQMQYLKGIATQSAEMLAAGQEISDERQKAIDAWNANQAFMQPTAADVQENLAIYLGSYTEIAENRAPKVFQLQTVGILFFLFWRIAPVMLIGMALMKTGILTAEKSASYYRRMMLIGYGVGLPLSVYSAYDLYLHQFDGLYAYQIGNVAHFIGAIFVSLGHIALIVLMIKSDILKGLLRRFAAVGRMALSNYLMHSIILTTVFYGYGMGLYGSISRFGQMGFVLAVIMLQLLFSPWWLARYRFGPVEWLWRSLTYWQRQPMRCHESS